MEGDGLMDHVHMLAALAFGVNILRSDTEVAPIFTGTRPGDGQRLMISPRTLETNNPKEKDMVTSVVATAMRAWGATEIMFLCDAYIIRTDDPAEAEILPSENPKYMDALIVNMYRADGPDEGIYVVHHLDDQGKLRFEAPQLQPAPPPEAQAPAITDQNRFPRLIHAALSLTDEAVAEVLATLPLPSGPITDVRQLFAVMGEEGYAVMEGNDE
jgi:hypothetical protein